MATKKKGARSQTATAPATEKKKTVVAPPSAITARGNIKVRVLEGQMGYYGDVRRREGDVFVITDIKHFSKRWMEFVDKRTPNKVTTGNEDLRKKHQELVNEKSKGGQLTDADTGSLDPGDNPLGSGDGD